MAAEAMDLTVCLQLLTEQQEPQILEAVAAEASFEMGHSMQQVQEAPV